MLPYKWKLPFTVAFPPTAFQYHRNDNKREESLVLEEPVSILLVASVRGTAVCCAAVVEHHMGSG